MNNTDLLREALQIDYKLRSTFFFRKLQELGFVSFDIEIDKLVAIGDNFNWESRAHWNISATAWQTIVAADLPPLVIFAHPRVLQEQPKLSAYYRNIAVLSQKAVSKLVFTIANIERGQSRLTPERAIMLCQLYNSHTSLIIESGANYSRKQAMALLFASAGAQINGSWLNQIGLEAELVVRKMLIRAAVQHNLLVSVILRGGTTSDNLDNLIDRASELSGMRLKNQTCILFSSEPDIALLDEAGRLVAVVEVKGGKDTAGALERYGAAEKSFEQALRENPHTQTIFVASCITEEVENRLASDKVVHHTYNLTTLMTSENQRETFVRFVLGLLGISV